MKIFVISHSCVVDVNQQVYVALNALPDTDVGLLMPANWKSEYTGADIEPRLLPETKFPVWQEPVRVPGHVTLHHYKQFPFDQICSFRPDVLLSTQEPWSLSGLQALRLSSRLRIPFAFQTNQNILKNHPPPFSWIERASYKRAAIALAYSEEARQVMVRKGISGSSEVVPYATDIRLFQRRQVGELRSRLGLENAVVLGYLGRIVPEKGLDTLVEAMRTLTVNDLGGTRLKVLIVGSGAAEDSLKEQVAAAGLTDRFVFAGAVSHSEAPEYMSCMDIFVLPSRTTTTWKEQFGRVIIEALAASIPVVGSDSGQIPSLIHQTGGGLIFREGDALHLARQLETLVRNPAERARLAMIGRKSVLERFTCEAVARELRGLLAGIIPTPESRYPNTEKSTRIMEKMQ